MCVGAAVATTYATASTVDGPYRKARALYSPPIRFDDTKPVLG